MFQIKLFDVRPISIEMFFYQLMEKGKTPVSDGLDMEHTAYVPLEKQANINCEVDIKIKIQNKNNDIKNVIKTSARCIGWNSDVYGLNKTKAIHTCAYRYIPFLNAVLERVA